MGMGRPRRLAVQKYHDRVAPRYDDSYESDFWRWHDELTWDYIKPHLPRDLSVPVLDLGCGTGKWGLKLLDSGFRVTFVDIALRMVEQARRKVEEHARSERASFLQADLCDLAALPDRGFGFALALGDPIGCAESPARAMKEIRRVLADDGLLVATFDNRLAAIDFYLERGDVDELGRFLRDGRTHWLTRDRDEQFPIHTFAPGDVVHLIEKTGFSMVEMVGKTVLPLRKYQALLADSAARRRWAAIEKRLCRDGHALARASHLQVVCRVMRS
jgi:SAM-dependent methyltransferase